MEHMKKKLMAALAALAALLVLCGFTAGQKVYDYAGLLSQDESDFLEEACLLAAEELSLDIVLLTTDDAEGKSAMEYADDFYDQNGFGYDRPQGDGVLMLIDMDNREVWISTCGVAIAEIDDFVIDKMLDNLYPSLTAGDYAGAFSSFLEDVQNYKEITADYESEGVYNPPDPSPETDYYVDDPKGGYTTPEYYNETGFNHAAALIMAGVISLIVVVIMVKSAGGQRSAVSSAHYLNHNAIKKNLDRDTFLTKTVSVRYIPPPPPPSGGGSMGGGHSSSHTSSGGVSHGGGGRSF